jgi:hypothetical protein
MREGEFEILVLDAKGTAYPEQLLDGRCTIGTTPGDVFTVKVTVYQGSSTPKYYAVMLYIDGQVLYYYHKIELLPTATEAATTFKSFPLASGAFELQFAEVRQTYSDNPSSNQNQSLGTITAKIFEARPINEPQEYKPVPEEIKYNAEIEANTNSDDKKFWKVPALFTGLGKNIGPSFVPFVPPVVNGIKEDNLTSKLYQTWQWNLQQEPVKVLIIHYQDEKLLKFSKVPSPKRGIDEINEVPEKTTSSKKLKTSATKTKKGRKPKAGKVTTSTDVFLDLTKDEPSLEPVVLKSEQ